jgi:hypothetical protein
MEEITGIIGREALIEEARKELKKGKHLLVAGPIGIGKSAVLAKALDAQPERRMIFRLYDQQAKGQFVGLAQQMLAADMLPPAALLLPDKMHAQPGSEIPWQSIRRHVNRLSLRDLTHAIIPALAEHAEHGEKPLIAVDDLTYLTPTQQAFWLAVFEFSQIAGCASNRKHGLRKLWWKMQVLEVPPLPPETATEIVRTYIAKRGVLIESPELYTAHVVRQSGGVPQAIHDMLDASAKERVVDKRRIREMRHDAGVRYFDFTPVMIVAGAGIVALRYVALGMGDRTMYVMAGIGAAMFLAVRMLLAKGSAR